MTSAPNPYLKTKIMTASPLELRLMLFDGAIRFCEQGRKGIADRDFEAAYNGISRCQRILIELMNSLDAEHDPELCKKLTALYTFMYTRLVTASTEKDPVVADEVIKLLRYERETWQMLIEQSQGAGGLDASPPTTTVTPSVANKPPAPQAPNVSIRG